MKLTLLSKSAMDREPSKYLARRSSISGYTLTNADRRRRLGRVQRQIYRCLVGLGRPARIRDLLKWCYPSVIEFQRWHRTKIHRAITRVAVPIAKTRKRFATTWQLREPKTWGDDNPSR